MREPLSWGVHSLREVKMKDEIFKDVIFKDVSSTNELSKASNGQLYPVGGNPVWKGTHICDRKSAMSSQAIDPVSYLACSVHL
jgi:hypothetical protein